MRKNILLLHVMLLFLIACNASPVKRQRFEEFDTALTHYNVSLRWAMYREALEFHRDRDGKIPEPDLDALKAIRVTGYQVTERIVSEDLTEAEVSSEFSYYHDDYGKVKKEIFKHIWWYEPEAKRWYNASGFPEFK